MLGHSMGTLRSYKLLHKVKKDLGGLGHAPPTISQPPRSVSLKQHHLYGKLVYGKRTRLVLGVGGGWVHPSG